AGLSPGNYSTLGNDVILEESGRLFNPETGYLVGSSSTIMDCISYLRSLDFIDEQELSAVGFYNPLKILDINPKSIINRFG
ncbi:MAG: hypothetical protein RI575_11060, partial [Balneolaceae bacterium]|nr:hypothetical protein [Balneolaceae bacterium]